MTASSCPMCGAMGWGGMVLGAALVAAAIAALIAPTISTKRIQGLERKDHANASLIRLTSTLLSGFFTNSMMTSVRLSA